MSQTGNKNGNRYRALLLDVDGTLVDDDDQLHPDNLAALRSLHERGVRVMVATGRSELSTIPVLEQLGLPGSAVVFNGAAVWCPATSKFLEERTLSDKVRDTAIQFGLEHASMTISMCAGAKYALPPKGETEKLALRDVLGLTYVEPAQLAAERVIRITLFSPDFPDSAALCQALEEKIAQPIYTTHFPLSVLAHHRESNLQVVDLHPPCRGKGEALRFLQENEGIDPEDVVAVGDATNDICMFRRAGLAVAMENAMPEAKPYADRVIGDNNGTAIAELVEELFGSA